MDVLKFGGSSLDSAENLLAVKNIVESYPAGSIVVISAYKDITDKLLQVSALAASKDKSWESVFNEIKDTHLSLIRELIKNKQDDVTSIAETLLEELRRILQGLFQVNDLGQRTKDYILSFGERLLAFIMSILINEAEYIEARDFIKTDGQFGKARVNMAETASRFEKAFKTNSKYAVFPGFIGSDAHGNTTTLGRGGADYSAAVIAASTGASKLILWTKEDGFMSADPGRVDKAFAMDRLSYAEAMELSHFGASVIYTPTIQPVYARKIPIYIKNIFKPEAQGTVISNDIESKQNTLIRGISSMDDIDLVTIQGVGLVGVTGTANRLFTALNAKNINVILITQASSEFSISFAVAPESTEDAINAIHEEFYQEIELRQEVVVQTKQGLSIIAIVGERMINTPGISATLFSSLARNGINVIATAQGSSELNISVVIEKKSLKKALNAIHEGFFLSNYKDLHLYIVGTGTVGGSLLQQLKQQQEKLREQHHLNVNVIGIARSRKMLIQKEGMHIDGDIAEKVQNEGIPTNLNEFIRSIKDFNLRNSVFIDCTADENVATYYADVFDSYCSIVTANKIACSSDYQLYKQLIEKARAKGVKFKYETNVGAGLPIISTINDLNRSGDKILGLEAVLSGTLNYIFNVLSKDIPLSKAIMMAKEAGFSEPDPRIDLSGKDVVRKLLILARESGYPLEEKEVEINSFLPVDAFEGSLDSFWEKVKTLDDEFEAKRTKLEDENKRWRFVASFNQSRASVELLGVDQNHPAYNLEGSNNILLITSERYKEQPMIIKGYGAGAEVTAAGVFADVIRIMNI